MYASFMKAHKDVLLRLFNSIPKDVDPQEALQKACDENRFNIYDLAWTPAVRKLQKRVSEKRMDDFKEVQLSSLGCKLMDSYRLMKEGEKIFRVEESLALQLMNTDLKDIPARMIKVPYPVLEIEFPPGLITVKVGPEDYVVTSVVLDIDGKIMEKRKLSMTIYEINPYLHEEEAGHGITRQLDNEIGIKEQVHQSIIEGTKVTDKDQYLHSIDPIVSLVFNLLLYISSPEAHINYVRKGPEPEYLRKLKTKERKRLKDRYKDELPVGVLGGNLVLSREERELYISNIKGEGDPLMVKVLVMGHWRQQWYGSRSLGTAHQKPKWIQPFWRGRENTVLSNKVHMVQ